MSKIRSLRTLRITVKPFQADKGSISDFDCSGNYQIRITKF